jgi:hypothetical protein
MAIKEQLPTVPASVRGGLQLGDEQFLWGLVILEALALLGLRQVFRRNHGG